MTINTTNITEANNFLAQTLALNDVTGGVLFSFVLLGLFGVILIVFIDRGFKEAFIGASAMTSILSIIFWSLELIGFKFALIPLILVFIGVLAYLFTKD